MPCTSVSSVPREMTLQPRPASEAANCDPYAVAARDPAARLCTWDGRSKGARPWELRSDGHQGLPGDHHLVTERGRGAVPTRTHSRHSFCASATLRDKMVVSGQTLVAV